ncbi:signal recognition particle-docking protein FtsY [Arthrobacter livingstonensis]|uniref:Signal recognition particle receptor FtsY n=1 Tax=Arthrobacter livingstonensis TaxID=670078 RepID=A0A2V5L8A5_9MICC|nr:signal recognition particle-docking protein FtsY [Arthrobacter livingstonensis]PYI66594.1 signal recognition particle-docking protein FtsY [Arthrobacter livingstonensis]
MNQTLAIIVYIVIGLAVVGGLVPVFLKARKNSQNYTGPRDANDPAPLDPSAPDPAGADSSMSAGTLLEDRPETQAPASDLEIVEPVAPSALETPLPAEGRLVRLRARLAKSNTALGKGLLALLSGDKIDEGVWEEVEETLLLADIGTDSTMELVDTLRDRVKVLGTRSPEHVQAMLREELIKLVDPTMDRSLNISRHEDRPAVLMVVGVNGVGKTTTVGKLARVFVAEDKDVLLGAADTFRAAAAEQLATWGARVGVPTVKSDVDGADPASVAFEAVKAGIEGEVDVVMIDTAGRLQNKVGLMDELGKVKRVIEKQATVDEVLLVLDATTGQNGLAQAKVFSDVVNITGIVLTKLDGTAKGGIVVAIQKSLGVPVKLVGLGEGADDLAPFDAESFVDALLS